MFWRWEVAELFGLTELVGVEQNCSLCLLVVIEELV